MSIKFPIKKSPLNNGVCGFTLVEILVVISIIALLASILFASFSQARARARDSKRIQDLLEVQKALELYRADHGIYPPLPDVYAGNNQTFRSMRVSCWECNFPNDQFYDSPKLSDLLRYLNPRPSSKPDSSRFSNSSNQRHKGFWYKVSGSQQDYKLALIGVLEEPNSIPAKMLDTTFGELTFLTECEPPRDGCYREEGYRFVGPTDISVYSSEKSRSWRGGDSVDDQ